MNKKSITRNKMSMKRFSLLLVLSIVFVMCFSTTAFACTDTQYNQSKFQSTTCNQIGDASKYAVFSKNYTACVDMEGNIATKCLTLNNGTHFGLSQNVTGCAISYIETFNFNAVSEVEFLKTEKCVQPLIIGNQYNISKSESDKRWHLACNNKPFYFAPESKAPCICNIKDSSYTINFDAEFKALTTFASNLSKKSTTVTNIQQNGQNGVITCKDGLNILNMTMAQYNALCNFDIKMSCNAQLVINICDYNGQTLNNNVCINGTRESYKDLSNKLIWNFGSYNGQIKFQETTVGCILAPCGKVDILSTHNGNVIADTVINSCGEIHKNDFCLNIGCVNNDVTPTSTPTCKPTAKPTCTPNNDKPQKITPTVAPSVTPTCVPTCKPTVTPTNDANKDNTPKTGDVAPIVLVISLAVVSLGACTFIVIRKRKGLIK